MIVCSCVVISDRDIEHALLEILSAPNAPLPTPGIVYRHLQKKMVCCGCCPLAVDTIYRKIEKLAAGGVVCPYACACAKDRLSRCAEGWTATRMDQQANRPGSRDERTIAQADPALIPA
jgi:hypothetical protein